MAASNSGKIIFDKNVLLEQSNKANQLLVEIPLGKIPSPSGAGATIKKIDDMLNQTKMIYDKVNDLVQNTSKMLEKLGVSVENIDTVNNRIRR